MLHCDNTHIQENQPLARYTSWRIGGPARYYIELINVAGLCNAFAWAREHNLPILILGGGTNMLIRDSGFPGLVIRYRSHGWHIEDGGDEGRLHIQAGTPVAGTARRLARQGWQGLEWAEGLPGTIGGAIYGNAGCYGGDIASLLEKAHLLVNGQDEEVWSVDQMAYRYRFSSLKARAAQHRTHGSEKTNHSTSYPTPDINVPPIILAAEFRVTRADADELIATMDIIATQRKQKTPWGHTCGSVFKNPGTTTIATNHNAHTQHVTLPSAGQLIDQVGLKGKRIGGAEISQRHANYIVNVGGATSDDVLRLIELARTTVFNHYGIELELEVQIV